MTDDHANAIKFNSLFRYPPDIDRITPPSSVVVIELPAQPPLFILMAPMPTCKSRCHVRAL